MLRGACTTVYQAANLDDAVRWYSDLLGTEPYLRRGTFYAEFRIGDYQHELGIISHEGLTMIGATHGTEPGGVVAYWHVDDVDATLQRLLAMGAREHQPPRNFGEGFIGASVVDPFGNVLGIMRNPHYLAVLNKHTAHPSSHP